MLAVRPEGGFDDLAAARARLDAARARLAELDAELAGLGPAAGLTAVDPGALRTEAAMVTAAARTAADARAVVGERPEVDAAAEQAVRAAQDAVEHVEGKLDGLRRQAVVCLTVANGTSIALLAAVGTTPLLPGLLVAAAVAAGLLPLRWTAEEADVHHTVLDALLARAGVTTVRGLEARLAALDRWREWDGRASEAEVAAAALLTAWEARVGPGVPPEAVDEVVAGAARARELRPQVTVARFELAHAAAVVASLELEAVLAAPDEPRPAAPLSLVTTGPPATPEGATPADSLRTWVKKRRRRRQRSAGSGRP